METTHNIHFLYFFALCVTFLSVTQFKYLVITLDLFRHAVQL